VKELETPAPNTPETAPGAEGSPPQYRSVVTKEFWMWLIWIAAAFAIAEMLLAHRLSQSR
jgi:hypothetical protein